jgi:hypothetical protein
MSASSVINVCSIVLFGERSWRMQNVDVVQVGFSEKCNTIKQVKMMWD